MDQSVMVFASAAARTTALPTPTDGMVSYLTDSDRLFVWRSMSSAWVQIADSTNLAVLDSALPTRRNAFINGGFDFWQRGTSFTNMNSTYGADRWVVGKDSTTTVDMSRQTFTPGAAPVAGYEGQFHARLVAVVGGANPYYMVQRIEDVRSFAGETVTLSFWAKSSVAVANTPLFVQNFGSGGSSAVIGSSLGTQNITTSWQRFTSTFAVPSISGKTLGANSLLEIQVIRTATSATVDVWGVQLESGSVATPFIRAAETLQGELAACQRYYWRASGTSTVTNGIGSGASTTLIRMTYPCPVTMRVAPTSIDYSNLQTFDGVTALNSPTAAITYAQPESVNVALTYASGVTQYRPYFPSFAGVGHIGFSAEL